MKLTILGSGYFIPTKDRNNSGYLLEIGSESVLLDTGSGTLRQLIKCGHSIWDISKIFYSHLHIDHTADLLPILFTRKYSKPDSGNGELLLFGHDGFRKIISGFEDLFDKWIITDKYPYQYHCLKPGKYNYDSFSLTVYKGIHADQSLMYRFEDMAGKTFLYTGDTDISDELLEAASGVDGLLTELSCTDENPVPGHLTPSKISQILDKCRPKLTILSHLSPETEKGTLIDTINVPPGCIVNKAEDFQIVDIY
jgi:ribonuclease BN (tRNA processing enzyme)